MKVQKAPTEESISNGITGIQINEITGSWNYGSVRIVMLDGSQVDADILF